MLCYVYKSIFGISAYNVDDRKLAQSAHFAHSLLTQQIRASSPMPTAILLGHGSGIAREKMEIKPK